MELSEFFRELSALVHVRARRVNLEYRPDEPAICVGRGSPSTDAPLRLVINSKSMQGADGKVFSSTSMFVAHESPAVVFLDWALASRGPMHPQDVLNEVVLEVEDASPDSTLCVILLLARLAHCDLDQFPMQWMDAAESWERTGVVEDPWTSWAPLSSSLAHSHFPVAHKVSNENLAAAWLDTLRFAAGCLCRGVPPATVPAMHEFELWRRATAILAQEEQAYHDWLAHAEVLQLSLPLARGEGRRLFIDALFMAEDQPTGAAKVFYRNDRTTSPLKHGYSLAAHYRPSADPGEGNEFTIALDTRRGVDLKELWIELERRENAAWESAGEERPTNKPRKFHLTTPFNQPWYIDPDFTLVAPPTRITPDLLGTKLNWHDVREAIWSLYNPLVGLQLIDRTSTSGVPVPIGRLQSLRDVDPVSGQPYSKKRLLFASWPHDRNDPALQSAPRALSLSDTAARMFAALIKTRSNGAAPDDSIALQGLVPPGSWSRVELSGGFAIVTVDGAFILDDWRSDVVLSEPDLRRDFINCTRLDRDLGRIEQSVAGVVRQLEATSADTWKPWSKQKIVAEVAAIMFALAALRGATTSVSSNSDARKLHEALDHKWALDRRLTATEQQLANINAAMKAQSDAATWRTTYFVSVAGFALVIATGLAGPLSIMMEHWRIDFWHTGETFALTSSNAPAPMWWLSFALLMLVAFVIVRTQSGRVLTTAAAAAVPISQQLVGDDP